MASTSASAAIEGDLRRLFDAGSLTGLTDGELLERFLRRDGESAAAFEAILTRHGPAVWSACNLHGPPAWAEDAFQATFLILFRRAGTLRVSGSLAPWLVEVARRTALKARTAERRRRAREGQVALSESAGLPTFLPDDIAPLVRAEVDRLPAKYREPIHLCYFEGRTQDEAAVALNWPVGTVRGRLARARKILRTRLARRGIASAGWLAAVGLTETRGEVPASLRAATLAASTADAPLAAGVVAIADQVIRGLALSKASVAAGLALVLLSAGAGWTAWINRGNDRQRPTEPARVALTRPQKTGEARTDRYGDPLPRGAIARLGTARFRQNEFDDGHAISKVLYSPDGKTMVTVGVQGGVNLWDASSGRKIRRLDASDASISPDGQTIATVKQPGLVQLWGLADGRERRRARSKATEYDQHLTFSPDGRSFVAIGVINKDANNLPEVELVAWDAATLAERFRQPAPGDLMYARAFVFSPDTRIIAVASPDRKPGVFGNPTTEPEVSSIRLYDSANGSRMRRIFIKHFDVGSLAFSPDGQTLAAGIGDRTIRRYDPATGMERLPRLGRDQAQPLPKPGETAFKWYEDAARAASALAFSADGSKLVTGQEAIGYLNGRIDEAAISVWDIASGRPIQRYFGHYGGISSLAFAPEGKTFASAGGETVVRTWDLTSGRETEPRPGHKGQGCELAVSAADGTVYTSGNFDHVMLQWDPVTGNCLGSVAEGLNGILAMDVAPDGNSLLIDTWDGMLLWDIAARREIRRFSAKRPAHTGFYRAEFSPDGRTVTMGLRVWETATGRELASFVHRQEDGKAKPYYMTARYTPDSRRLIGFEKHGIGVLDIATGKEIGRPVLAELKNEWLSAVSPDGRLVATGNFVPFAFNDPSLKTDLVVRIYALDSGKQVAVLEGHTDQVTGMAFSPDGRTIATAAGNHWHRKDRTIRIWDVATGRELQRFDNPDGADTLEYLPDGRSMVSVGMDGVATVWDVTAPSS